MITIQLLIGISARLNAILSIESLSVWVVYGYVGVSLLG